MIKGGEILEGGAVAELVLVLRLHHGRSLGPQSPHRLEDVHHPLVLHPLQHDGQADEDSGPANSGAEDEKCLRLELRCLYAGADK